MLPEGRPRECTNFQVYRAVSTRRTYLVVSTSAVRQGRDSPQLPEHFAPTPALEQLADEMAAAFQVSGGARVPVTLKVHGFNTRRKSFEREVLWDSDPTLRYVLLPRHTPPRNFDPGRETFRPDDRFMIGFRWPSEGLLSPGSLKDTMTALLLSPVIGVLLFLLPILALLWSGRLARLLEQDWPRLARFVNKLAVGLNDVGSGVDQTLRTGWPPAAGFLRAFLAPYLEDTVAGILLGTGLLFLVLRVSTYLRDRYRALHYGVPDLGEFMRALEEALVERGVKLRLDVIGHSMGTLLLINAFRVMSDYFHGSGAGGPAQEANTLGRRGTYELGTLCLCAPDIPALMVTTDRNNYFLSALRRFAAVHIFCSDRDIILKWLSGLANWVSEPRYDMGGRKLGNVVLVKTRPPALGRPDSRANWMLWPVTRPVLRHHHVYETDPLSARSPAALHFHDCTQDESVSGTLGLALAVTLVVSLLLGLVGMVVLRGPLHWLAAANTVFLGLGLLCQPLWSWARDRGQWGGVIGFFAEWPTMTMFLTGWRGWNPHGGYFMFQHPPRHRIAALLRDPQCFPRCDDQGLEIEELDEHIRYKLVRVSV